jgi:DNA-binding transcriptional ArsR family regulator
MVRYMPNHTIPLDHVFYALADPTRRAVFERLSNGPAVVSNLAYPFDMSLPSLPST